MVDLNEFRGSSQALQEKFKNLYMSAGLGYISPPSVHAVPANQVPPARLVGVVGEIRFNLGYQGWNVLRVIKNRNPDTRLVGRNAFESFEHLKIADPNPTHWPEVL
jgi:hypothetical protein